MHFFQRDIYLKSFKKKNSEIPQSCIYHIMYFDFLLNVYITFIFHPPKATTDLKNIEDFYWYWTSVIEILSYLKIWPKFEGLKSYKARPPCSICFEKASAIFEVRLVCNVFLLSKKQSPSWTSSNREIFRKLRLLDYFCI